MHLYQNYWFEISRLNTSSKLDTDFFVGFFRKLRPYSNNSRVASRLFGCLILNAKYEATHREIISVTFTLAILQLLTESPFHSCNKTWRSLSSVIMKTGFPV